MKLKNLFALSDSKGSLGDQFRLKRFAFFENCLATIVTPTKILDVGGTPQF